MNGHNCPFFLPAGLTLIAGMGFLTCTRPICTREYLFEIPFEVNIADTIAMGEPISLISAFHHTLPDLYQGKKHDVRRVSLLTELGIGNLETLGDGSSDFELNALKGTFNPINFKGDFTFQVLWETDSDSLVFVAQITPKAPGKYVFSFSSLFHVDDHLEDVFDNRVDIEPGPCEERIYLQFSMKSQNPDNNLSLVRDSGYIPNFDKQSGYISRSGVFAFEVVP